MIINELAQWAVLLFLVVLVLGLTRQLGHFLLPHHEQVLDPAPDVGDRLPAVLTSDVERDQLAALADAETAGLLTMLVLNEQCNGCQHLLEDFEKGRVVRHGPLAFVAKESSGDFVERMRRQADLVIEDADAAKTQAAGISATPFLLVLDRELRVKHRDFSGNVYAALKQWNLVKSDLRLDDAAHIELDVTHVPSKPNLEVSS